MNWKEFFQWFFDSLIGMLLGGIVLTGFIGYFEREERASIMGLMLILVSFFVIAVICYVKVYGGDKEEEGDDYAIQDEE